MTIIVTHVDTGTTATVLQRLGVPALAFGCSGGVSGTYTLSDLGAGVLPCVPTITPGTYRASEAGGTAVSTATLSLAALALAAAVLVRRR